MNRVLFLDDDELFLGSMRRSLLHLQQEWDLVFFSHADAALASVVSNRNVILVVDWMMPQMDGLSFAARAREAMKSAGGGRMYTIMLTVKQDAGDAAMALDRGIDDFMTKPVDVDELIARIRVGNRLLESGERQTMTALKESEEKWRSLVENAPDIIIIVERSGRIQFINRTVGGIDKQRIVGQNLFDFVQSEYAEMLEKSIARVFETGKPEFCELVGGALASAPAWYSTTIGPITRGGELVAAVLLARDVTSRKKVEEDLKGAKLETEKSNHRLEQTVEHAHRMALEAEMASRTKSDLLVKISNEIRIPLDGMNQTLDVLSHTDLDGAQRSSVDLLYQHTDTLIEALNNIIDFSALESGTLELQKIDFNLRTMIDDAIAPLALQAGHRGLSLTCFVDHALPALFRGDPGRLRQIFVNLVGNAIKFTDHGEINISVELAEETETEALVRFGATDTGIGVGEEKLDLLFESFSRTVISEENERGGMGLSLSISKQLAEGMGGQIGVESEEGKGSTFWFTVSLERQPHGDPKRTELPEDMQGSRLLVVDKNAANRYVLREQLLAWGCQVDEVEDGAAALYRLRRAVEEADPYDIAILDMAMPGVDGETIGRLIRGSPELEGTSLVIMTAVGKRGDASRLQKIGFDAYLTKPVTQSLLFECLFTVANRQVRRTTVPPLVTRHSVNEKRKANPRLLVASGNATHRTIATTFAQRMGYGVLAVDRVEAALSSLAELQFDLVLIDAEMATARGAAALQSIRDKAAATMTHPIPIVGIGGFVTDHEAQVRFLDAGLDDCLNQPLDFEILRSAVERLLPVSDSLEPELFNDRLRLDEVIFDKDKLLKQLGGDTQRYVKLIGVFLEHGTRGFDALKQAIDTSDTHLIEQKAFSLRHAFATIKADSLCTVVKEIETACRRRDIHAARQQFSQLERDFEILSAELKRSEL